MHIKTQREDCQLTLLLQLCWKIVVRLVTESASTRFRAKFLEHTEELKYSSTCQDAYLVCSAVGIYLNKFACISATSSQYVRTLIIRRASLLKRHQKVLDMQKYRRFPASNREHISLADAVIPAKKQKNKKKRLINHDQQIMINSM